MVRLATPGKQSTSGRGTSCIVGLWRRLLALLSGISASAHAQEYPTRAIRAITNLSAGGLSDIFMRALGDELHKRWGQTVVVENRPGGAYNIGARACGDAAPDGYTICILLSDAIVYNPHLFKNLPFDERTLQPVMNLFYLMQTLAVNASLNVKTVDELVAYSKAKPKTLSYQSASPAPALYMDGWSRRKAPIGCACRSKVARIQSMRC